MSKEAMKLALEALEYIYEGANNQGPHTGISWRCVSNKAEPVISALREALAEPQEKYIYGTPLLDAMTGKANEALDKMAENARELGLDYEPAQQQEPVAWKLVPKEPTDEMLKAMDECSTEGYDERLYAGHAASVYMAAVDVAPSPPQRKEPEPVVWMYQDKSTHEVRFQKHMRDFVDHGATYETPLYTTPPAQRTWVGLSDEEKRQLFDREDYQGWLDYINAIEAKLKEKNT